ncbi:TetR/AcrR family transcriptional regulator [Nocardia sp. NPDC049149]|uniref:TetR/AcrR family transcriptional regulator n=1 Tax=Nocardia sp. NPDC049149 TaxID=3364315 RepID=UPI00371FC4F2
MARPYDSRLSAEDWARAAMEAMAGGGLSAVVLEPLARSLGVTKGSFYAHFRNREELIDAALTYWENSHGAPGLAAFAAIPDPAERLQVLLRSAIDFSQSLAPSVHVHLLGELDNPRVRAVVHRVTEDRIALIARTFEELGHDEQRAQHRAQLAYSTYVGLLFLARERPDSPPDPATAQAFLTEASTVLIGS